MKQKRKKLGRKLLGFLLTLAMVVGPMLGMGMTALAVDADLELGEGDLESANQSRNLAVDANGVIHIVYKKTDGSIVYTKSTNSGVSFSDVVTVVNNGRECEVAVSSNGRVYVAYYNDLKGYVAYSDDGNNFTSVELSGSDESSIHLATDGDHVYAIQMAGAALYYSSDKGVTYKSHTDWNWYAYSDVHVDTSNHKVIVLKDNPSVVCRVSEDYGETFTEEKPVKCNNEQISVFYSTATVGSGYAYMSGQNGTIYKINYNDATATEKTVNASSVSTGRSLSSDENNNVIVGYVNDDGKVYYQLSTDGGTTFEDGIAVADATSANAAINIKTGDVLFLYSKDGKIMLHREIGVIKGNVNYINDSIEGLEPNTEYMVEVLGDNDTVTATYYISSNETGNIPFIGIDKDGNAYEDLAGKKIKITKAGTSDVSDPIDIEKRPTPEDAEQIIDENYAKPEDVAENEVLTTENSITIHPETGSKAKQSYKIFNADGTEIAGQDWVAVDENGDIVFSGLSEHTEYLIKAIVPATQTKPRSYELEGVKITTMGTIEVTNPTELSFVQDGLEHEFEITTTPADAKKEYSLLPEENYTEEIVKLKDPGRYTVYYKASKDNYRTVYGSFDVEIREAAPADIVAVAKDYNGVYDGKAHSIEIEVVAPQTGAAVSYGTKEGEYTLTANPSYTDVGTYKVFYRVTAEGRNEKTGSADIVIEKADSTVTTAPAAKTLTYNGQAQELVTAGTASGGTMKYAVTTANQEPAAEAYTFDNTSIPAKTAAGTYYVWYKVKADNNHNDTDANYVEVSIGKRSVTLTSATASKVYDGTALTNTDVTVGGDGFVTGEGVTCNVTGSQILPGNTKNTFTYTLNSGTTAGNYEITKTEGTLTVTDRTDEEGDDKKYEITVTANSNDFTYDGTEHSVSGFVQTAFTFNGVTYTVSGLTATAKGTDVGSYTAEVTGTAVVKDANDNNLTNQFIVSTSNGTLTINKRNVTLTSATASKTYDGNALTDNTVTTSGDGFATGEGATYSVTGSQKVVGSSANAFTYTLNTGTKEANYNITKTEGTLKVTSRDAKYQISPQANSDEVKYDGQSHEVTGFETDTFTVEGNTYTVSGLTAAGSGTDAGSYTVSVSGTAVVKDSDGNDVSDEFAVTPQTGTLTINKRSVTLTSASDEKEYDGDALTNDEVTVTGDGFVTGEGATYDVTGTRTLVGSSENAFTYTLNEGTKADNYDITPSYGTLTVNNRNTKYEVTLTANSGTEKYDGNEKTVSGYTIDGNAGEGTGESVVTSFTASNGKTYTVTGMSAEVTGTNAGEYAVNVIGTPIVKDADGNDVTAQFAVSGESGKLTIDKRSVTLTSATDTKVYDGKALSNDEITVSEDGFAEGEGATYDVTGSQTLAGELANAFTYALSDGTIADNYDITTVEGKLTVTKSDSSGEVTAVSGLIYDGKAKALVTARKTEGGSLMYRLGTDGKWQQDIPEATDAGTYKIYYYIKGDDNHKDDGSEKEPKGSVETTIKKDAQDKPAEIFAVAEASDDKTADGKISGFDKTKTYQYSADDGKTWTDVKAGSTEIAVKSGTYQIRYAEDKNHEAGKTASVTVTGKNDVPGTGDTVNIQLIILVMILSMCGIFALCNLRSILEEKKRRK